MNNIKIDKDKEAWQENAKLWQSYGPPLRPSAAETLIYDLYFSSQKKDTGQSTALVLGDCPEIRDLLAYKDYVVTVAAHNPQAVFSMDGLRKYSGINKEKVLITNWQDLDLPDESFDVIVSDWGLNSLTQWRDYTLVLSQVQRLLKPKGGFITRLNIFKPQRKVRSLGKIMDDFSTYPDQKFSYLIEMELYSTISTYDPSTYQVDLGKFYREEITKAYHAGQISFSEWQEFYYPFFEVKMTYPSHQEWEKLLQHFLNIQAVRYGHDYLISDNNPIYISNK